jgi:hypothetical protein
LLQRAYIAIFIVVSRITNMGCSKRRYGSAHR